MEYRRIRHDSALSLSLYQLSDSMPFIPIFRLDPTFVLFRRFNCLEVEGDRSSAPLGARLRRRLTLWVLGSGDSSAVVTPG